MSQSAYFSFEVNQDSFQTNQELVVSIFINTDQPANTVFTKITFSPDKLEYLGANFSGSSFPGIAEKNVEQGTIRLTAFTTQTLNQNKALFCRINFKTLADGQTNLVLETSSKIHANDGLGTNLVDVSKLPMSLSLQIGQEQQAITVQQGQTQTASPVSITQSNSTTNNTQPNQNTEIEVPDGSIAGQETVDYSTFSSSPKLYPPDTITPQKTSLFPILIIGIIFLTTIIILIIMKYRKKNEV